MRVVVFVFREKHVDSTAIYRVLVGFPHSLNPEPCHLRGTGTCCRQRLHTVRRQGCLDLTEPGSAALRLLDRPDPVHEACHPAD